MDYNQIYWIQRRSFYKRFFLPVALMVIALFLAAALYDISWRIENTGVRLFAVHSSVLAQYFIIMLQALVLYPFMYFRGSGRAERIIGSLIIPAVILVREASRAAEVFTLAESVYYGLNSFVLLTVTGAIGQMGICEMICRLIEKRRHKMEYRQVVTPVPVIAVAFEFISLFVLFIWGVGVHWFYRYMEVYKKIFL